MPVVLVWFLRLVNQKNLNCCFFKYLGLIQEGVEDLDSDEVKKWKGALEKYFLEDLNGKTRLRIELETAKDYLEMMDTAFKKGFEQVKQLTEG